MKVAFNTKLKKSILVNSEGFTLYAFADDKAGKPTCLDDITYHCAKGLAPSEDSGRSARREGDHRVAVGHGQTPWWSAAGHL